LVGAIDTQSSGSLESRVETVINEPEEFRIRRRV
jgi:hypothetical protein